MAKIVDLVGEQFADTEIVIYSSSPHRLVVAVNRPHCIARVTIPPKAEDGRGSAAVEIILVEPPLEVTP